MKSEDDNTLDATIIHESFDGEKEVETIEGMQPFCTILIVKQMK